MCLVVADAVIHFAYFKKCENKSCANIFCFVTTVEYACCLQTVFNKCTPCAIFLSLPSSSDLSPLLLCLIAL